MVEGQAVHHSALQDRYRELLGTFPTRSPDFPQRELAAFGEDLARGGLGPDEIVALHDAVTEGVAAEPRRWPDGHPDAVRNQQFLIRVLAAFGTALQAQIAAIAGERDEAAARAEQERGGLLVSVAHEMRTPLTAALGAIELIERDLARERFDRVGPRLRTAREALQRLSRQTMDITRASRGDRHNAVLAMLDLRAIVASAASWAEAEAGEKGIAFRAEPGGPLVSVNADRDALLSVVGNLLSNAIRYTPAGGAVRLSYGASDEHAWIEIADTGIGMTDEVQERIFEKFYRAPEARAVEAQGLGLGLSMVRDLVADHGGRLDVSSVPHLGSTFRVILPCLATDAEGPEGLTRTGVDEAVGSPRARQPSAGAELLAPPALLADADHGPASIV